MRWLLRYALFAPMDVRDRGREKRDAETLGISLAVRPKIGEPGGTCTLNPPADNGALCCSSYGSAWWEALVTLQSSLPAGFATPGLQPGSRATSLKLVAGVGVAPTEVEFMRLT